MKHFLNILYLVLFFLAIWLFSPAKEKLDQLLYDMKTQQKIITQQSEIDAVLNKIKTIRYENLPNDYLVYTWSDQEPFKKILSTKSYFIIEKQHFNRFLVGDHRVKYFLPNDKYYKRLVRSFSKGKNLYALIDNKLLYKLLELQEALYQKGYNETGFKIINGHRHPQKNKSVGGASKSRHILGEALDISILDINDDGKRNYEDKEIVLEILENSVIANEGGIGRYPHSMSIHFDVRGYKARWDKQ